MKIINYQPQNTKILARNSVDLERFACAYLNGKIYTFGGETSAGALSNLAFVYDIATDTWSSIANYPISTSNSQIWVYNNLIYIQGGRTATTGTGTPSSAFYRYNPSTNTYTTLSTAGGTVHGAHCGIYLSFLYRFGGYSNNGLSSVTSSVSYYSTNGNTWTSGTNIPSNGLGYTGYNSGNSLGFSYADCPSFNNTTSDTHFILGYNNNIIGYNMINDTVSRFPEKLSAPVDGIRTGIRIGTTLYLHGTITNSSETYAFDLSTFTSRKINSISYNYNVGNLLTDGTKIYSVTQRNSNNELEMRILEYTPDNQGTVTNSTTLISDFSSGTTDWTVLNSTTGVNRWATGTAGGTGTTGNSLYISTDGGVTKGYNTTSASISHIYRDIIIPTDGSFYALNFVCRVSGEDGGSGLTCADFLNIIIANTSQTPTLNTAFNLGEVVYSYPTNTVTQTIDISKYKGQTIRLVFSWQNNAGGTGTGVGATIDTIQLVRYNLG